MTKPPQSERAELCLRLMEHGDDPVLYLAGDGVYNLLDEALRVRVPEDFYQLLVEEMVAEGSRIYSF